MFEKCVHFFLGLLLTGSAISADFVIPEPNAGDITLATLANDVELLCEESYLGDSANAKKISNYRYEIDRKTISDLSLTNRLRAFVRDSIQSDSLSLCFEPRHYVSYPSDRGMVEMMICFQCTNVEVRVEGNTFSFGLSGSDPELLNSIFRDYGVRIPVSGQKGPYSCKQAENLTRLYIEARVDRENSHPAITLSYTA